MSANVDKGSLESRQDFKQTPGDQYRYWMRELKASESSLRSFRKRGSKIVDRYVGGGKGTRSSREPTEVGGAFHLNLFHSNVITLMSMLYVQLPQVMVKRRFDDTNDDVGRVAAMIMQRLLENDLEENGEEYSTVLKAVLQDRLLPGLGVAKVRYEVETEIDPETGVEAVSFEDAPCDYFHWRDMAWGWGRAFSDLPWIGFRSWMTKDQVRERFGDDAAEHVELQQESVTDPQNDEVTDAEENSPWKKAPVWEIWDKEKRQLVWVSPGYDKVLDTKPDPLGLTGFYPCPPFLLANPTTSLYIPTPDFYLAQDLYNEVDVLQTRISIITEAVKVVGVYNRECEGIQRVFKEGTDNDLIPVDNWALFAENGGVAGQIDWVPLGEITEALLRLRELRDEAIGLLQQVTGMSDIMRGELGGQYEGVGQSELKAKFGSVRVQALQDDLAKFASDLLQLKAEVISRHYDSQTIAARANIDHTFDLEQAQAALELIKNPEQARLRVAVKPESVGMADYAQLKAERTEYIGALSSFFQGIGPIFQEEPGAKPYFLEILKWGLAGFKGTHDIESVLDKAIETANAAALQGNESPSPEEIKAQADQAKSEAAMQLEQMKHENAMAQIQEKAQADMAMRQTDLHADIETTKMQSQAKMQEEAAAMQMEIATIKAKMVSDIKVEQAQSEVNAAQQAAGAQSEVRKGAAELALDLTKLEREAELEKEQAVLQAQLDIKVAKAAPKPEEKSKPKSEG